MTKVMLKTVLLHLIVFVGLSAQAKDLVVFIAPHPDDESIGMGGAIARAVEERHLVYVDLMTKGGASKATKHVSLSSEEFKQARVNEFLAAVKALKVTGSRVNDFPDTQLQVSHVQSRIRYWKRFAKARKIKRLRFVGTLGGRLDYNHHPDHDAVFKALQTENYPQTTWQAVYHFRNANRITLMDWEVDLTPTQCAAKRIALDHYRYQNPMESRYGIGWRYSTSDLFIGAYRDCIEYVFKSSPL